MNLFNYVTGIPLHGDVVSALIGGKGGSPTPPAPERLTWEGVLYHIEQGDYATSYQLGELIPLDLGTEGLVNMQIVSFDADDKADGTGKTHITFISKELLATSRRMNPPYSPGQEGTGSIGGWELCEMRSYLKNTIKPLIRSDVRNAIVEVAKYTDIYNASGFVVKNSPSTDDVWIPSSREVGDSGYETLGASYSSVFSSKDNRTKMKVSATYADSWWLRSPRNTSTFEWVGSDGGSSGGGYSSRAVALGFCL